MNKTDNNGATALYIACQTGHTETVAKLLAANANVDQVINGGYTPIMVACHQGHLGIVQILEDLTVDARAFRLDYCRKILITHAPSRKAM